MTYGHLTTLLYELNISPEQLGERLGIAGKTTRRWTVFPKGAELPALYATALRETVLELAAEGRISSESKIVNLALKNGNDSFFRVAMKNLGMSEDFMKNASQSPEIVVEGIVQIGASEKKRASVDRSWKKILSYQKISKEWKLRVQTLSKIIKSDKFSGFEKFAAYGALFYLISPFDLIPDNIPVFGLLDDYLILGLVVTYYLKRFPKAFGKNSLSKMS